MARDKNARARRDDADYRGEAAVARPYTAVCGLPRKRATAQRYLRADRRPVSLNMRLLEG